MINSKKVYKETIVNILKNELPPNCIVLVHSSLSSFGYVVGGAKSVVDALCEITREGGTALFPTLTGTKEHSVQNPPIFNPISNACWTGLIPETARKYEQSIRSLHPTHSVSAIGKDAELLTKDHINSLTPCDDLSPYGKLAKSENGYILLIGVSHNSSTMFHHVEEIAGVDYHMLDDFVETSIILNSGEIKRHYLLHKWGTPRNFGVMEPILIERKAQKQVQIGESIIKIVKANIMVEMTLKAIRANSRILCNQQ